MADFGVDISFIKIAKKSSGITTSTLPTVRRTSSRIIMPKPPVLRLVRGLGDGAVWWEQVGCRFWVQAIYLVNFFMDANTWLQRGLCEGLRYIENRLD